MPRIDNWFIEDFEGKVGGLSFKVDKVLYKGQSEYQDIKVVENSFFGRVLLLDDIVMLSDKDEFYYHDMLVHVPMVCARSPRHVLVIGGGDGGTVREVLKHPGVERVVLCEIDAMVIDVAKRYFPSLSASLDDERVEIVNKDGSKYIKQFHESFDCICIDSTDPIGPGEKLFTKDFYSDVKKALRQDGCMSAQSESPAWSLDEVIRIRGNIASAFGNAHVYTAPTPCYPSGFWSFTLALVKDKDPEVDFDLGRAKDIAKLCRYYNPSIHRSSFALPNFIVQEL